MSELLDIRNIDRSSWRKFRFEQIAKSISERVEPKDTNLDIYVGLEHLDPDTIHINRTGRPSDVDGTKLKFYKGDVIFGRRRAYQRKAALAEFNGICSAHSLVLRANPEVIDPNLFPFFLHSDLFMHRAIDISVGSLSPTINWGTLKNQEFLLPPKDQQSKLVELLWVGDEALIYYMQLKDRIHNVFQSFLNKYFFAFMVTESESSPQNFVIRKLAEVTDISGGSTPDTTKKEFWNGNIPWVSPTELTDIREIFINKTQEYITESGLKAISNKLYPAGTILFTSRATIGNIAINQIPMATNQGFTNFICKESLYNKYLYFCLVRNTPYLLTLASGTTFLEISKSHFKTLKIVLPPLEYQIKNSNKAESIKNEIQRIDSHYKNLNLLIKSIINNIFT